MLDNLEESLVLLEYQLKERNAIVQSIARIIITTMSSIRVNHLEFSFFINYNRVFPNYELKLFKNSNIILEYYI